MHKFKKAVPSVIDFETITLTKEQYDFLRKRSDLLLKILNQRCIFDSEKEFYYGFDTSRFTYFGNIPYLKDLTKYINTINRLEKTITDLKKQMENQKGWWGKLRSKKGEED